MLQDFLASYPVELTNLEWGLLALCALLIGMDKAGLRGVTIITVPIFAGLLGGRLSSGTVLPLLMSGDAVAMLIYRRKAAVEYLKKLLPAAVVGLIVGMYVGLYVSDRVFTLIIAFIVAFCLVLMVLKEYRGKDIELPDHWVAHSGAGLLGGVSTMIGNAAGPIMSVYLLALNLPKEVFIGTGAVFFFIINILKVPIHLFFWHSITLNTLRLTVTLIPFVLLGMLIGFKIVKLIPEKPFRIFVLAGTAIGTIRLFF
jgi:uncharacterized membrane protein YfcA